MAIWLCDEMKCLTRPRELAADVYIDQPPISEFYIPAFIAHVKDVASQKLPQFLSFDMVIV